MNFRFSLRWILLSLLVSLFFACSESVSSPSEEEQKGPVVSDDSVKKDTVATSPEISKQDSVEKTNFEDSTSAVDTLKVDSTKKDSVKPEEPIVVLAENEMLFLEKTMIVFSKKEKAEVLLSTSDVYSQGLTQFDLQAKTQKLGTNARETDYLQYAKEQARSWSANEMTALKAKIVSAEAKIKNLGLKISLPDTIQIVKSSGQEEGDADYTRLQYIVLTGVTDEGTFLHELFHVYSRFNSEKRDAIYATLGFQKCNPITYPSSIQPRVITNPDAPILEHYLPVTINGEQKEVVFMIRSKSDYTGGSFFGYLEKELMLVEGDGVNKAPTIVNNDPILKDYSDASNLLDLIGRNTDYNIHPEEVSAEHFRLLVGGAAVTEPKFLEQMKAILK